MRLADIRKIAASLVLILAMLVIAPAPGKAAQSGPLAQMKESVNAIVAILNNQHHQNEKEMQERIMTLVRNRFDFREMSKLALARHWRDLSEPERKRFTDLFAELLKNTYIGRVTNYSQKKVQVDFKSEEIHGDRAVVDTVIIVNNTVGTPINYRMKRNGEKWEVYDVVIEGVSLIRNYRTQFTRIIEREKFAGLMKRIQNKVNSGKAS
jgi:phospholipid transport system substrate-binding protein